MSTEQKEETGLFEITKFVMKTLKLDDEGRVQVFFGKEKKKALKAIKTYNKKIDILNDNYKTALEALEEEIEDVEMELVYAKGNFDIERIKTNDGMKEYSEVYWKQITDVRIQLDKLSKSKIQLKDDLDIEIIKNKDGMKAHQFRIDFIKTKMKN